MNNYKIVFTNRTGVCVEYKLDDDGYHRYVQSLPRTKTQGGLQCVCYRGDIEINRFRACSVPQEARGLRTNGPVTLLAIHNGAIKDRRSTNNVYTLDMIKLQTDRCEPVGYQLYVLYDQMVDTKGVKVEGTSEVIHCKRLPMLANYGPIIDRRTHRRHTNVQ